MSITIETRFPKPVILFVRVAAKQESQNKAKSALLADVFGARTEQGNFKMELYQADNVVNDFYLFERWQSQSDLEQHFAKPYTQGAFELQKADVYAPIEMNYLEELWPLKNGFQKDVHRPLTTLIVPFEVVPGAADEFVKHFSDFVPVVRKEAGNIEFHFHRVIGLNHRFVLYERWERQEDLDAHNRQQTTLDFIKDITPLLTKPVMDFVLFARDISG